MQTNIIYFFIFTCCIHFCVGIRYDNYTLFRGIPVEEDHLQYFKNLSKTSDYNFWRAPGLLYKPVEFVVGPATKPVFLVEAERRGLYLTTILEDVQKAFDKQTVKTYIRRNMNSFDWNNFFRLDDIYKWLTDLAVANPTEMTIQSIGRTEEKRDIMAAKIVLKGCKMRSKVIIEGGIHAREWISPAFVTYLINEIIKSSTSGNEQLKEVAITYEWYFVPVLNPDGYEYSHTMDRLWRKNRNGEGVDLNRNFNNAFGTVGVSKSMNSDTYCGPSAFSEKESKAMRNFVTSKSIDLEYYLAFHAYGQYMIIPYANSKKHMQNFDEVVVLLWILRLDIKTATSHVYFKIKAHKISAGMFPPTSDGYALGNWAKHPSKKMCTHAGAKIATKYRTTYTIGTAFDTVGYMTSGVSGCWVKKTFGVPYVVTFELRDGGYYGFALPMHKIMPTCRETMDGVVSLLAPKKATYSKLRETQRGSAGPHFILDKIVIVFNVLLFIIVRFD